MTITVTSQLLIGQGELDNINLKFVDDADVFNRFKWQLIFLLLSYNDRFCYQIKPTIY